LPARSTGRNRRPRRRSIVLIFGESENDRATIEEFFRALRPDFVEIIKPLRDPLLLIKDASPANLPRRAEILAAAVRSEELTSKVVCVLAHEDCDAVEPAHVALSDKIEAVFIGRGIKALAATPAWEMETWLFLWPDASKRYRPKWRRPDNHNGTNVGMLTDAKEKFVLAVRPSRAADRAGVRDYRPSDSPMIAAKVRNLGIIGSPVQRRIVTIGSVMQCGHVILRKASLTELCAALLLDVTLSIDPAG
jgi:hypothetical protein